MSDRPKRKSYNSHPGQVVKDAQIVRRTKAQIAADNARKEEEKKAKLAADEAKKEEAAQRRAAGIQRIAAKEDEIQQEQAAARKNAARPDKITMTKYKEHIEATKEDQHATSGGISDDEMLGEEQGDGGTLTDDVVEFPPMSTAGSDSEQGFSGLMEEESGDDGGGDDWVPNKEADDQEEDDEDNQDEAWAEFQKSWARKQKRSNAKAKKEKVRFDIRVIMYHLTYLI